VDGKAWEPRTGLYLTYLKLNQVSGATGWVCTPQRAFEWPERSLSPRLCRQSPLGPQPPLGRTAWILIVGIVGLASAASSGWICISGRT